jgi:hypothetical protein
LDETVYVGLPYGFEVLGKIIDIWTQTGFSSGPKKLQVSLQRHGYREL